MFFSIFSSARRVIGVSPPPPESGAPVCQLLQRRRSGASISGGRRVGLGVRAALLAAAVIAAGGGDAAAQMSFQTAPAVDSLGPVCFRAQRTVRGFGSDGWFFSTRASGGPTANPGGDTAHQFAIDECGVDVTLTIVIPQARTALGVTRNGGAYPPAGRFRLLFWIESSPAIGDGLALPAANVTTITPPTLTEGDSATIVLIDTVHCSVTSDFRHDPSACAPPLPPAPSAVRGLTVEPRSATTLFARWSPAAGTVNQYRVTARQVDGDHLSRTYSDTTEKLVDRLLPMTEYSVTVAALSGVEGVAEGPTSDPVRATTMAAGPAEEPEPDEEPVPALPLAGAALLALALAAAGVRRTRRS